MASISDSFERRLALNEMYAFGRRHLDTVSALVLLAVLFGYRDFVAAQFASGEWDLGAFYSALFDWTSIQSAFLFGVYVFFLGRTEPFIRALSDTNAFDQLRGFVRHTVYLTLAMTVACIPVLVTSPSITDGTYKDIGYIILCAYSAAAVYLFARFLKVVRIFRKLEKPR